MHILDKNRPQMKGNRAPAGSAPASETEQPPAIAPPDDRILVSAKDAARILGVGPTKIWTMTNRMELPHVRLGKRVLYPRDELKQWVAERIQGGR